MRVSVTISGLFSGLLLAASADIAAAAEHYPVRPVRLLIPYAPGGPVDIVGRVTAQKLTEAMGQQVIVDNRAGAGGNIALELAAKAAPDGYTLLMGANGPIAINPGLYRDMPVDPATAYAPVSTVATSAMIFITHPSVPAAGIREFIQLARAKPAALFYASSGSGSTAHLAAELFRNMAEINIVHVPYKGAGPALTDLVGGQVHAMITGISSTLPHVKAGRLKALGVSSEKRIPLLPEVPAIAEALPGYEVITWYGVFAPAGTPGVIVSRLNQLIVKMLETPDARARLAALGADAQSSQPAQFARMISDERSKWARIIRVSGAKPE